MDLSYGPEYEAFRATLRAFLEASRARAPRGGLGAAGGSDDPTLREWQKLLIEHGYAARTIPKRYGGFGAEPDILKRVILDEEFGALEFRRCRRAGARDARADAARARERKPEAALDRTHDPRRGDLVPGLLRAERASDLANVQTRAVEDGDDFVINGQKIWTTTAQIAHMMFGLFRSEPGESKHGRALLPADSDDDARHRGAAARHHDRPRRVQQVFFTNARVPKTSVVGKRGEGWKIAGTTSSTSATCSRRPARSSPRCGGSSI